ncbi:protein TonB [Algoriphagus alkaliphilus]|uniref:Protein TonB n=1 Tax=Algoriphagus alkaliphilus TaxID=279824 RepID=A0A1G5VMS1_9BACT|nr:energy transducer TonB [Algoriphagus alkaliphilus]MBA4301428.1 energy transducer TonB [Cyclobacterium sp.]SDA47150.1 protein TonB [Algoriphagus alkaliphilus]
MELKKNPKSDLLKWSGAISNLGLAISIAFVLVAFEWKAYEEKPLLNISNANSNWESEVIPITIEVPPGTPPPVIAPQIKVIDDDIELDDILTIDIHFPGDEVIPEIKLAGRPIIDVAAEILDFTEVQAQFPGGMYAWYTYLKANLTYPKQSQRMGIEGSVFLRFVINTDIGIQDVEVVRSVYSFLDKVALEVVQNSPRWKSALHHGRPVRSRMTMPIKFKLN